MPELRRKEIQRPLAKTPLRKTQDFRLHSANAALQQRPEQPKENPFAADLREPTREELDPLSRIFFDANVYLNSYLDALKELDGDSHHRQKAPGMLPAHASKGV